MSADIVSRDSEGYTVQVRIPYATSMLEAEASIQTAVNEVGMAATGEALGCFDTDGSPIHCGPVKLFSKGQEPKNYQTPYGPVRVARHVYQCAKGGQTFCPMEQKARIIITSTPKFARMVASKYADMGSSRVQMDLRENHGRLVHRAFVQTLSEAVGAVIAAKEDVWHYTVPELDEPVHSIAVGLDGTMMLLCESGYREAMVGTLALFDQAGKRQHTIYLAASPEYGKATFLARLTAEISHLKSIWPGAHYIGLADGTSTNWDFLTPHTDHQTIDFWHAASYLGRAAGVMFGGEDQAVERVNWLDTARHRLKHRVGGATRLWHEMQAFSGEHTLSAAAQEVLDAAITYFGNHRHQMTYAKNRKHHWPIGSGVTEAACKVIVKQRLCGSGMKWKEAGAAAVLRLRSMNYSSGQWEQFWQKVGQYGLPTAA